MEDRIITGPGEYRTKFGRIVTLGDIEIIEGLRVVRPLEADDFCVRIHPSVVPHWSGNWEDSLLTWDD